MLVPEVPEPEPAPSRSQTAALSNAGIVSLLCNRRLKFDSIPHASGTTLIGRSANAYMALRIDWALAIAGMPIDIPFGSMTLSPSCLISYLPALRASPLSTAPASGVHHGCISLAVRHRMPGGDLRFPNMWWAGNDLAPDPAVVDDIIARIDHEIVPFFAACNEPSVLLNTLEEGEAAAHAPHWDVGQPGSLRRLLYMGYAAIACGDWAKAERHLRACAAQLECAAPLSSAAFRAEYADHIDRGLICVARRSPWQADLDSIRTWQEGPSSVLRQLRGRPEDAA